MIELMILDIKKHNSRYEVDVETCNPDKNEGQLQTRNHIFWKIVSNDSCVGKVWFSIKGEMRGSVNN